MPNRIQVLPPVVAERIAAGEVIERPSSVVKELVENALDAGATEVSVTLEDGGRHLIEVLDNGHGMGPEDLAVCIERHATSKLSALSDLEKIATLGFRGEALPSIAAVSELSLISRAQGETQAYELRAGDLQELLRAKPKIDKITFGHFNHTPHGTRVQARGLFSQIPARLKFLKSPASEVTAVKEWLERLSIAYPGTSFQLTSNERKLLSLRPQSEEERVRAVLSDGGDYSLLTGVSEQDRFRDIGLRVRVHWLQGMSSPQSRKLIQVVNRRAIRDRLLQQALLMPFRQALLPGQFPSVALILDVNPAAIDVNVHPSKAEIRFLDSRKVFSVIENTLRKLISDQGSPGAVWAGRESGSARQFGSQFNAQFPRDFDPRDYVQNSESALFGSAERLSSAAAPYENQNSLSVRESPAFASEFFQNSTPGTFQNPALAPDHQIPRHPFPFARFVGVCFQTYLIYEQGGELIWVDQHAAHERVRYEAIRKKVLGTPGSAPRLSAQSLLIPEAVKFPLESRRTLETHLEGIQKLGFECEIFSEDTLLFRAVPAEWGHHALKARLKNFVERILDRAERMASEAPTAADSTLLVDEMLFEALASEACHSAVRAGDALEPLEIQSLFSQLFECDHPWNCPHGRPTVVRIGETKIEEWFQRKVNKKGFELDSN